MNEEIEFYADVLCPWSYIGKRRVEAALPEGVRVRWRSHELSPDQSRLPGLTAAESMKQWWGDRTTARVDLIHSLSQDEGLPIDLHRARPVNTFDAHRLVHLGQAHGLADQVMERMLRAYLCEGLNVSAPDVLERLAVEAGLAPDAVRHVLHTDAYAAAVRSDERQALPGIPTLMIGGTAVTAVQPPADLRRLIEAMATPRPQPSNKPDPTN